MSSIDTDRKVLMNCLAVDSTTGKHRKDSTVLTRLLKGQDPSLNVSENSAAIMLNLEEVTYLKKTALESNSDLYEFSST
jgi:hypothetical protein